MNTDSVTLTAVEMQEVERFARHITENAHPDDRSVIECYAQAQQQHDGYLPGTAWRPFVTALGRSLADTTYYQFVREMVPAGESVRLSAFEDAIASRVAELTRGS